jgi:Mce-associated membrane protein
LALVLASAALLIGGATATLWIDDLRAAARETAAQRCLARSAAAAQAIFSYDYRTFDASVANARPFLAGDFAREYAETTAGLKAAAEQQQAIVRAEVEAASITDVRDHRVELLLYVNQYRRNTAINGEKVDQNRVVLTMLPRDNCRVVKATAI